MDKESWSTYQNVGNLGIGFNPYHTAINDYHRSIAYSKDYSVKYAFVKMGIVGNLIKLDKDYDSEFIIVGLDSRVLNTPEYMSQTREEIIINLMKLKVLDPDDSYKLYGELSSKYSQVPEK